MRQASQLVYWFWIGTRALPFLVLLALAPFISIAPEVLRANASEGWPTTPGQVIASGIHSVGSAGDGAYTADVAYKYQVADSDFVSSKLFIGTQTTSRAAAEATHARYPVGGDVAVHYNPDNPNEAVLEPGFAWDHFPLLGWAVPLELALLVLLCVAGTVIYAPRSGLSRRLSPLWRLPNQMLDLQTDLPESAIAERTARYGERRPSPDDAIMLAAAYAANGQGRESERYAREALNLLDTSAARVAVKGPFSDTLARQRRVYALFYLAYAKIDQGEFAEAAAIVRRIMPHTPPSELLCALVAWAAFLAGDTAGASAALEQGAALARKGGGRLALNARYRFLVAYLRLRVLGEDTRLVLAQDRDQLAGWAAVAARHAGNPYGARLQEVLADARAVLAPAAQDAGRGA